MVVQNYNPFPVLQSERLILRRIINDDVDCIFNLRSNAETMKFVPRPLTITKEDALNHIKIIDDKIINNEGINWAITLKDSKKMIGIIGHYRIQNENFRSEIGYMLLPEFHSKGIITEAINETLNYGFTILNLHSVEAIIDPQNFASEKALQKNSFIKEAHFIEYEYYNGIFLDTVVYSILKRNFIYNNFQNLN